MTDTFTDVVIDSENQKPVLSATKQELKRLLETIETDILPKTVIGVENGNKVRFFQLYHFFLNETTDID